MGTEVVVTNIPPCDFPHGLQSSPPAVVDGKTKMGPWAYMCQAHYAAYGVGLGTGRGQKLVKAGSDDE
jgi:hypothetical protein